MGERTNRPPLLTRAEEGAVRLGGGEKKDEEEEEEDRGTGARGGDQARKCARGKGKDTGDYLLTNIS